MSTDVALFRDKLDLQCQKDLLFVALMVECLHGPPGAALPPKIRARLESLEINDRKQVVSRLHEGCTPLVTVCKRGQVDVAEYLVTVCNADIEQRGLYKNTDDDSVHVVTPLWCAAVSGKIAVVKLLTRLGADVNAPSDTGSTPVRSACFMTHVDVVYHLVSCGADINKQNTNGGTCLINSVQNDGLCKFLIQQGAHINAKDIQDKTALHYAILEHRLDTAKLLILCGADCFDKTRDGDDALQLAALKGAIEIFDFLLATKNYPKERIANCYELLGSTLLDEFNDSNSAIGYWKTAMEFRSLHQDQLLPKEPYIAQRACFEYVTEFQSMEELLNIATDVDAMRMQSLLICERVLGAGHKDSLFRLMFRGAFYAESLRFQRCVDLWKRALEIRIEKEVNVLSHDVCSTAQTLIRLLLEMNEKCDEDFEFHLQFNDLLFIFLLLNRGINGSKDLLEIRPVAKHQVDAFDNIMKCISHVIFLMLEQASLPQEIRVVDDLVKQFIRNNPRSPKTNDTILHLCMSKENVVESPYFYSVKEVFPNAKFSKYLLHCGSDPNAINFNYLTPLHIATLESNFDNNIIQSLLDYGAHIDRPDREGNTPAKQMQLNPTSNINVINYLSLKCLAAQVVRSNNIPYNSSTIPETLKNFADYH